MTVINLLLFLIHKLLIICMHRKNSIQRVWCYLWFQGNVPPPCWQEGASVCWSSKGLIGPRWLWSRLVEGNTAKSPVRCLRPSAISGTAYQSASSEAGNHNTLPIIVEQGSPRGLGTSSSKKRELASLRWGRRAHMVYRALDLHENLQVNIQSSALHNCPKVGTRRMSLSGWMEK